MNHYPTLFAKKQPIDPNLQGDLQRLSQIFEQTLSDTHQSDVLTQVNQVRELIFNIVHEQSQTDKIGGKSVHELTEFLQNLHDDDLLPLSRALTQFLNLANSAEQYHNTRTRRKNESAPDLNQDNTLQHLQDELLANNVDKNKLYDTLCNMQVELVLTAHPTEVARRTLIQKYNDIHECLTQLHERKLTNNERDDIMARLERKICAAWHTDEIRYRRPTPVDEAKWGFTTIEQSLWSALPKFLKKLDALSLAWCGKNLPITAAPISFASWMGGDRDGNPNVTADVTDEVIALSRWSAAVLFLADITALRWQLSMNECNLSIRQAVGDHPEPYRQFLRPLRDNLKHTIRHLDAKILGQHSDDAHCDPNHHIITENKQILQPLLDCYESLVQCGLKKIADGALLDMIRRVQCFGMGLVRLDIREDSSKHSQCLDAITHYLELGLYSQWDEHKKQAWLLTELQNKRPLLAKNALASKDSSASMLQNDSVRQTLSTFATIARQPSDVMGAYVISMAKNPSDILAVMLLQKQAGVTKPLRVVPLFETLDDLEHAKDTMQALLDMPFYKNMINGALEVMIGYSDSAKDAGFMAANWAQYKAQETLADLAHKQGVRLTLFHGRGGSVSRGGVPTHQALYAQPPGSISGAIRVTEQGEMVRFKLGSTDLAMQTLEIYCAATLKATLLPPPKPKQQWRDLMEMMTAISVQDYRQIVRQNSDFVRYLRTVTPELELQMLPLGSRPARRVQDGGVESLRAIPWVFAWTQIRLMLPAWLGTQAALLKALDDGHKDVLVQMLNDWPYFNTLIDMLEMVLSKADIFVAQFYELHLTDDKNLLALGDVLRQKLQQSIDALLRLKTQSMLLSHNQTLDSTLSMRHSYLLPLHYLQAELMKRRRQKLSESCNSATNVDHALMVAIAGIATGLRNTG